MNKRTVYVRNARIVPAETVWPGCCKPEDLVLRAELVTAHPVLGNVSDDTLVEQREIRTSLIVRQDLAARTVETKNTIYEVVA